MPHFVCVIFIFAFCIPATSIWLLFSLAKQRKRTKHCLSHGYMRFVAKAETQCARKQNSVRKMIFICFWLDMCRFLHHIFLMSKTEKNRLLSNLFYICFEIMPKQTHSKYLLQFLMFVPYEMQVLIHKKGKTQLPPFLHFQTNSLQELEKVFVWFI